MSTDNVSVILVKDLKESDYLVNVGTVQRVPQPAGNGYVIVTVREYVYEYATGRARDSVRNLILLPDDLVTIECEE